MRYRDLLRKSKELADQEQNAPADRSQESVSGSGSPGEGREKETASGGRRDEAESAGDTNGGLFPAEEYTAGETVVGAGGKESELERLYANMEKFMSLGHAVLTLDEERSGRETEQPAGEPAGPAVLRKECIPPPDDETTCWDLNQQLGTKSYEECLECAVYREICAYAEEGKGDGADLQTGTSEGDDREHARILYEQFVSVIKGIYQDARTRRTIRVGLARDLAERLLEEVPNDNRLLWQAINVRKGSQLASHALNVAIFSIKVGAGLGYDRQEMLLLTTAAILHDIGMTAIPEEILERKGKLTRQEYEQIKQHPLHSMEILRNSIDGAEDAETTERLVRIVGQEHERENGSGYPEGRKSEEIDELAKVIGVLDVFEALSHDRGHRSEYSSFQAIQVIIQMRSEFFSTKVVKAVITRISIFPLESYVMLNNGEIGKVVKTNYSHPMRPVVRIVRDSKGKQLERKREVDLSKNPLIFITRPVGEEEL